MQITFCLKCRPNNWNHFQKLHHFKYYSAYTTYVLSEAQCVNTLHLFNALPLKGNKTTDRVVVLWTNFVVMFLMYLSRLPNALKYTRAPFTRILCNTDKKSGRGLRFILDMIRFLVISPTKLLRRLYDNWDNRAPKWLHCIVWNASKAYDYTLSTTQVILGPILI